MRHFATIVSSLLLVSSSALAEGHKKGDPFMPKNDLHLQDRLDGKGGITAAQFNSVIDKAERIWKPLFEQFGATFSVDRAWDDSTVNAYADQSGNNWKIHMFGGLARRAEVTEDGFAMVVCHEIGHHLAGFPFVEQWASNEGQSDYYATSACAWKLFSTNLELAAKAETELPAGMKQKCDDAHEAVGDRDYCYRALSAGKSLADLLSALNNGTVSFDTPDTSTVSRTNHQHPAGQCRLDTYVAAALCGTEKWDHTLIPGKSFSNRNSMDAQQEAFDHSCTEGASSRPACWFKAVDGSEPEPTECPFGDPMICELMCTFDPSQPWCN